MILNRANRMIYLRKKKIHIISIALICLVVYVTLLPSACLYFKYVHVEDIANDIAAAVPVSEMPTSKLCPLIPPHLDQILDVVLNADGTAVKDLPNSTVYGDTLKGGIWHPKSCVSQHRVAIILPYRNREKQLQIFLQYIHAFLKPQLLDYRIIVVEQTAGLEFNRAALFNIGFVEGLKLYNFHCFIFHDVDLLPQNTLNIYTCSRSPRHMSVSVNTFRYSLPFESIFGGVTAFTVEQFRKVNGFSNSFYGWGGEDDDLYRRVLHYKMNITRWDPRICRYFMLSHAKEIPSDERLMYLRTGPERYYIDGLNSLNYKVGKIEERNLFTWILVDLANK